MSDLRPPHTDLTTRTSMPTARRSPRPSMLAPVIVGAAGLVVGGGLVYVLTQDDEGTLASSSDLISETTVPDGSATTAPEVATTAPATTVDDGPLRASAARIDGVTYLETAQCMAFPISNPEAGVGDAHVNVSLHRMESTDGDRVIVERWSEDGSTSIGITEPGGRAGRVETVDAFTSDGTPVVASVPLSDGATVELEHTLMSGASTCPTAVVQGVDEFSFESFGVIDTCAASAASALGTILTFQNGSMLQFSDGADAESFVGLLRVVRSDGSLVGAGVDGSYTDGGGTGFGLTGAVTPGYVGIDPQPVDTLVASLDVGAQPTMCLPAQEAAFSG